MQALQKKDKFRKKICSLSSSYPSLCSLINNQRCFLKLFINNRIIRWEEGVTKVKQKSPPNVSSSLSDNKSMFNFIRIIGKGGFGRVWKITDKKTKETYALKVIDKARVISKKSVQSVMNER